MIFFPKKYNWKYHISTVLGTVIKCQKGTGSAWETLHREKLYFLQSIHLQCSVKIEEISRQNDKADDIHCKYIQFFIVSAFHCNLVVGFTLIALSSPR